jgi:hypothetical protein
MHSGDDVVQVAFVDSDLHDFDLVIGEGSGGRDGGRDKSARVWWRGRSDI